MQDWYTKKTLGTLLDEAAGRWSAREGLTFAGQRWSFAELQTEVDRNGALGELWVRGYSVMQGYDKQPEATAAVIDAAGWLHTGDRVTMWEDGTIRFLGRYKDLLKVGGENVDPIEVEGFLLRHPAIDQVQIIGVPDARPARCPARVSSRSQGRRSPRRPSSPSAGGSWPVLRSHSTP
jgi:acyl-CoA synthetase (AMP-forming)/AMP-acid ligase II